MTDDSRPLPEDWVRDAREEYNRPGPTPRDEMWAVIEARITELGAPDRDGAPPAADAEDDPDVIPIQRSRSGTSGARSWFPILAAASAALLLGVGLGRRTAPPAASTAEVVESTSPDAVAPESARPRTAVRFAAARHLGDADALLAVLAADARQGRPVGEVGSWGRGLLTRTRLFLDSPVADDPSVRELLEDLEIVLAQVALLGDPSLDDERRAEELELLTAGLEQGDVRDRIRAALPRMDPVRLMADD
jgi:hypothetical protein